MSSRLIEVPLGLELVFPGGRVQHDFSRLPAPGVVRPLARAHLSLTNSGGGIKTRGTSALYARAIRRMAAFFDRELDGEGLAALDRGRLPTDDPESRWRGPGGLRPRAAFALRGDRPGWGAFERATAARRPVSA
jgi:hypothetical protein